MIIPYVKNTNVLNILINNVLPNINEYSNNLDFMIDRVISTPRNDYVNDINNLLIYQFPKNITRYYSFDVFLLNIVFMKIS